MAYASMLGHILIVLITIIAFDPRKAQSGFIEHPSNVTEYAGVYVEFQCNHTGVDSMTWGLNGTLIRNYKAFPEECRDYSTRDVTQSNLDIVYVFIIRASTKCNGTQVQCTALIETSNGIVEENSTIAILTVLRPDAVKNLNASFKENTFSIDVQWDPIPVPEPINRIIPLHPKAFVRNITYQVNITDSFGRLVDSSTTERVSTVILLTNNDINPCYYNVCVISIINGELKYSGNKARRGRIQRYEDFPSNVSVSLYNSTVIDQLQIQYVFVLSVSLYVCSANLILTYEGMTSRINMSNEIPGMISELIFVVNYRLLDKKYDDVMIFISNAVKTVPVTTPPLSTYDVQDVTVENGNLTVTFLNGSTAAGAFIVVMATDNRTAGFTFEYLPIEKSPMSNMAEVTLPYNTDYKSNSLTLSIYDIENSGLLKESLSLIPVNTLQLNASSLITINKGNDDDSKSDWGLVHVSRNRITHSIHFDCEIFKQEDLVIHGCSIIVHSHSSSQGLILIVNNSINDDVEDGLHSLEVKVQNESELYYYAAFPITSKGIIGSNAKKGSVPRSVLSNNNDLAKILSPLVIILFITISVNIPAFLCILRKHRITNGVAHKINDSKDPEVDLKDPDVQKSDDSKEVEESSDKKVEQERSDKKVEQNSSTHSKKLLENNNIIKLVDIEDSTVTSL